MMIVTMAGRPGSGKGTIAKILSKKLKYKYYLIGDIRRNIARKMGISLEELNKIGEKKPWTDRIADNFIKKLSKKDNIIVEGRIAWHFIPNSIKIFLDANPKTRAKRVFSSKRPEERYKNIEEAIREMKEREKSDIRRYRKYYKIRNCYDKRHFDYVIDTTRLTAENAARKIIKIIKKQT